MEMRYLSILLASVLISLFSSIDAFSQTTDVSFSYDASIFQIDDSIRRAELASGRIRPYSPKTRLQGSYSYNVQWHFTPIDISKKDYMIITTDELCDTIGKEIKTYSEDVHAIYGYGVYVITVQNATPQDIKSLIVNYQSNLSGVLFIGDLGEAMYEVSNDYDANGYANWPCDLYFMDLDGVWTDSDNNGIYDGHSGDVKPEIYIARLSGASMSYLGSEANAIRSQLQKSHNYWWKNNYHTANRALNYICLDWAYIFPYEYLRPVFPNNNEATDCRPGLYPYFSASDYLSRIGNSAYGFTQLAAHSWASFHDFETYGGTIDSYEILDVAAGSYAFNLHCCSACNWTYNYDCYLGGAYLFNNGKTMTVIGSTKTGDMRGENHFYSGLSTQNIGDSYLNWWKYHHGNSHNDSVVYWSYGMTILGDPTINFYHDVCNYCIRELTLSSFPQENSSNLILYRAADSITVTADFTIPVGVHVVFDAPVVTISPGFICQLGASFEIRSEGCILYN